jgi:hypothetical protein
MMMRVEPSQPPSRAIPRAGGQGARGGAGPHAKPLSTDRQAAKRLLARIKLKPDPEEQ